MTYRYVIVLALLFFTCSSNEKAIRITPLPSPTSSPSGEPYLFTDVNGKVFLSWIEQQDTVNVLRLAAWEGEGWTESRIITSGTNWFVNWADYPLAVSDGQGKFLAHMLEKSGEGTFAYDVKITSSPDGVTWTTPHVLHDDGKEAEHGFVSMVPYGEHVFVSWLDGRNTVSDDTTHHDDHGHHGEMTVRAAVVDYDGGKLKEWELDSRVCDCCQTTSAVTTNGPVVIYRDRSDHEVRDISIVRLVNNQWTPPQPVFKDGWEINGCPVNGPRCEAIGNTLTVAWFTMANDDPAVNIIFSQDGGITFGVPIRVDEGNAIGRVDVVLLDETSALVSWMEGAEIKVVQVFSDGKKKTPMVVASSSEARASGFPQMTKFDGGVMMAWTDAETKTIKAARLQL